MRDVSVPNGERDPVLPNAHELTGALVSYYNPSGTGEPYTDSRNLGAGDQAEANPQAQV